MNFLQRPDGLQRIDWACAGGGAQEKAAETGLAIMQRKLWALPKAREAVFADSLSITLPKRQVLPTIGLATRVLDFKNLVGQRLTEAGLAMSEPRVSALETFMIPGSFKNACRSTSWNGLSLEVPGDIANPQLRLKIIREDVNRET